MTQAFSWTSRPPATTHPTWESAVKPCVRRSLDDVVDHRCVDALIPGHPENTRAVDRRIRLTFLPPWPRKSIGLNPRQGVAAEGTLDNLVPAGKPSGSAVHRLRTSRFSQRA